MTIILPTDKKSITTRLIVALIYLVLIVGGLTMVYPFMMMITSSFSSDVDYYRYAPFPRSMVVRTDRYVRMLNGYFDSGISDLYFRNRPAHWSTWIATGADTQGIDTFAGAYLEVEQHPERLERWRLMAADYAAFNLDYPIADTFCNYDFRDLSQYLYRKYADIYIEKHPEQAVGMAGDELRQKALAELRDDWGIPYRSFFDVELKDEIMYRLEHATFEYPDTAKARTFLEYKDAYRRMVFRPDAEGQWRDFAAEAGRDPEAAPWPVEREHEDWWPLFVEFVGKRSPASRTRPFSLKEAWLYKFLKGNETLEGYWA